MGFYVYDDDMPITVAEKLITAQRPAPNGPLNQMRRSIVQQFAGEPDGKDPQIDLFTAYELKEIADYLLCYCSHNDE